MKEVKVTAENKAYFILGYATAMAKQLVDRRIEKEKYCSFMEDSDRIKESDREALEQIYRDQFLDFIKEKLA